VAGTQTPVTVALCAQHVRSGRRTGVERYALSVARSFLARPASAFDVRIIAAPSAAEELGSRDTRVTRLGTELRLWNDQVSLPRVLKRLNVGLAHYTAYGPPVCGRTPYVLTVHDAVFWDHEGSLSRLGRSYYRPLVTWALRDDPRLKWVVCDSEMTQTALRRLFPRLAGRSSVVRLAPVILPREGGREWTMEERLEAPAIVAVGTIEPRKNVRAVVQVFEQVRETVPAATLHVVGRLGWASRDDRNLLSVPGVVHYEHLTDQGLADLYSRAALLVSLSRLEGFNLPVAEARAFGLPVLISDLPVHHEVTGNVGCIFVHPDDVFEAGRQAVRVLTDRELWRKLAREARLEVRGDPWDRVRDELCVVYAQVNES
jgi:glycosyltransferase involved in cell wall biosynthesis